MKNGIFTRKSTSVNIVKSVMKQVKELTFESEIDSTPLDYKADFSPLRTCRFIIISGEELKLEIIKSTEIERIGKNFKIKSHNVYLSMSPGT